MRTGEQTVFLLGYAGLVPFVVPAIAAALGFEHALLSTTLIEGYAFGILSFLCGSWWGMALQHGNRGALLLSNLLFLAAFFVFVFAGSWRALTASLLLLLLFALECSGRLLPPIAPGYRRLRAVLTLISSASMLLLHVAR